MQAQKNIELPKKDFLHFLFFIDIVNKNYQYLSEYRTKGWILSELIEYCEKSPTLRNAEDHVDSVKDKYYELFAPPTFENADDAEQQAIAELFSKHNYAERFFISLEFYLENPNFFRTQFMTIEIIRAMKEYESKVIKL